MQRKWPELRWDIEMDRQAIIQEIQRTAAANGGKPLGRLRLESEAGIRSADWMRYWSRFSDAQREAGFEPNEKTSAYEEADLLRQLALLARELGRFPTLADIKVRAHSDETFPSPRTFDKRLGSKVEMTAKVAKFCSQNSEFADVLQWCAPVEQKVEPAADAEASTANDGFVYLIKSGRFYKIGKTNSVGRREREVAIQMPEPTRVVHSIKTDDPDGIEAYWHHRFDAKRKNGEWFDLTAQDVAAFRRRKFM